MDLNDVRTVRLNTAPNSLRADPRTSINYLGSSVGLTAVDIRNGSVRQLSSRPEWVLSVSPDSRWIATSTGVLRSNGATFHAWGSGAGQALFSPDSSKVTLVEGSSVVITRLSDFTSSTIAMAPNTEAYVSAISRSGDYLAVATDGWNGGIVEFYRTCDNAHIASAPAYLSALTSSQVSDTFFGIGRGNAYSFSFPAQSSCSGSVQPTITSVPLLLPSVNITGFGAYPNQEKAIVLGVSDLGAGFSFAIYDSTAATTKMFWIESHSPDQLVAPFSGSFDCVFDQDGKYVYISSFDGIHKLNAETLTESASRKLTYTPHLLEFSR